jgi:hypothetical protein
VKKRRADNLGVKSIPINSVCVKENPNVAKAEDAADPRR